MQQLTVVKCEGPVSCFLVVLVKLSGSRYISECVWVHSKLFGLS